MNRLYKEALHLPPNPDPMLTEFALFGLRFKLLSLTFEYQDFSGRIAFSTADLYVSDHWEKA